MNDWPELDGMGEDLPPPPPAPEAVRAALHASALDGGLADPGLHAVPAPRRAWGLLLMEARLLHPAIWCTSFLVMAVCVVLVPATGHPDGSQVLLALAAPLVAGAGVAGLYGPERDAAFEVVATTPTSPRVVLLARATLVFAYDLALALLASAVLALAGGAPAGLTVLVASWLGPMALLAALSLLLSVRWNAGIAVAVSLALWSLPALAAADLAVPDRFRSHVHELWGSGPLTLGAAAVLAAAALLLAGTGEPIGRGRATHRS
ncbi:hypothetical protein ACFOWE_17465 [Planomonospora corallina]|uniref:ABC-2 type transport system permease protein n=1 Tax=Planomonospora corallina TaxID=1806052 RepID=A0ABV8I7H3_9ACTN